RCARTLSISCPTIPVAPTTATFNRLEVGTTRSLPSDGAMNWNEFRAGAPDLAMVFEERLRETQLVLLGTNSASGWPRISPWQAYIADGVLMLGMMWQSRKARDLLRDSRLTVTTTQCDREAAKGDMKLYGYAVPVTEKARKDALGDAQQAVIQWRPEEPFH